MLVANYERIAFTGGVNSRGDKIQVYRRPHCTCTTITTDIL
jgi:hypothetical protein